MRTTGRAALLVAVIAMHACVVRNVRQSVIDFDTGKTPPRIELVVARDMAFSTPPTPTAAPVAPATTPPAAAALPVRPARQAATVAAASAAVAASAPVAMVAAEPETPPTVADDSLTVVDAAPAASAAQPTPLVAEPVVAAEAEPAAAPPPAASAPTVDSFGWPPSTRITYELTGNYRGEVYGSAQVDWVRVGAHYQVHLDVTVGASFAPLYSRRMSSDGQLTEAGLVPERYDEDSKAAFRDRKRASVTFESDAVVLNNGQRVERLPGVQDTASQFVQLTYLFTRHPELLKAGGTVEIPLALPRRVNRWIYDVHESEVLYTSFGAIEAVPLQPRRESRKGDELSAQVWFAPSLRYMPVRIRIQQDADTYVDLMIERRPQIGK